MKEQYSLEIVNGDGPVELQHPETKETVGSWTYRVGHEKKSWFGKVKFREVFEFAARKILTVDPKTNIITKIDEFDDPARQADVKRAYQWLSATHSNWCFKLKADAPASSCLYQVF